MTIPAFRPVIQAVFAGMLILFAGACAQPAGLIPENQAAPVFPVASVENSQTLALNRFVAFGDWGAGTSFQKQVATQVIHDYEKSPFATVLMLGDNIYPQGDVNKSGKAYFTRMYAPLIQARVRFVVALGNHDVLFGHREEQLAFFGMPGRYYEVKQGPFGFFVLDTNTFANDTPQKAWLAKVLNASRQPWKIVLGHHPILSSGYHGPNEALDKALSPLLRKYGVALYLAGHSHQYERFKPVGGVQYLVSGGGGAYLHSFIKAQPNSLVRLKTHHFLSFTAHDKVLSMEAVDSAGKLIDKASWTLPAAGVEQPENRRYKEEGDQ